MGGPSFHQLTIQITEPLSRVGPIAGYDFIVDDGDDEEESVEVPFDSDSSSNGVTEPITQSQPSRIQSQFQSQSSKHADHYSSLNSEAIHMRTFPSFGIVDRAKISALAGENELQVGNSFMIRKLCYLQ